MTGSALYVSYDGLLEPLGASQVLPYVEAMAARGISMTVLSFEKEADLAARGRVQDLERRLSDVGIGWVRRRWHGSPTLPATAWDLTVGRRAVRAWARACDGPGIVHARGYIAGMMARAGRSDRFRLLLDMRGFWVDERIEGGYWRSGSTQERIGRWVERAILRDADHIVSLTAKGVRRLGDLLPQAAQTPATVIPTCVRMEAFTPPEDLRALRARLGIDRTPVLIHVGTITGWYDGALTAAIGRAWVDQTGGSFLILTRDRDAARRLADQAGVEARIETARSEDVPEWIRAADAGLALVRVTPAKDASFATKVAEYLASGLAVLGSGIGDMPEFADGRVVELVGARSPEEAARWLLEAVEDPERSIRARALAEDELSLRVGVERLAGVYRELLDSTRDSSTSR